MHTHKEFQHFAPTNARILIAEDNPVNQRVTLAQLQNLDYHADAAANGREALEAMEQISYALVLMDCQMPVMDGIEATAAIREREKGTHHTPVIALTAGSVTGAREKYLRAGIDDYLHKPFNPKELGAMIEHWLGESKQQQSKGENYFSSGASPLGAQMCSDSIVSEKAVSFAPERLNMLLNEFGANFVFEVLEVFLTHSVEGFAEIQDAIEQDDALSLERAARRFKGSCHNVGVERMAQLCEQMEEQGRSGATHEAMLLLPRLKHEWSVISPLLAVQQAAAEIEFQAGVTPVGAKVG